MFNFLRGKVSLSDLMCGMYDVHSHLLPGVDDGSRSDEDSALILTEFAKLGVCGVYFTPHVISDLYPTNNCERLINAFQGFAQHPNIELRLGAEYMVDEKILSHLPTVGSGGLAVGCVVATALSHVNNNVLIEFTMQDFPNNAFDTIFEIRLRGYTPILAHPERYVFMQGENGRLNRERFLDCGCKMQLNLLSLTGWHGEMAYRLSREMLSNGFYSYVGTDTHNIAHLRGIHSGLVPRRDAAVVEQLKENNRELF